MGHKNRTKAEQPFYIHDIYIIFISIILNLLNEPFLFDFISDPS